jgi:hypothetical protein
MRPTVLTRLESHPLFEQLSIRSVKTLRRAGIGPKKGETETQWRSRNRRAMRPVEVYAWRVFHAAFNVQRVADRLEIAKSLLGRAPTFLRHGRRKIRRDVWIDYHLSQLSAAMVSLQDCLQILTAEVVDLGVAARHCTSQLVLSHRYIQGTAVAKAIKALDREVENHRSRRNRHLHQGSEATLGEYVETEMESYLQGLALLNASKPRDQWLNTERTGWRALLKIARPQVDDACAKSILATRACLDALLPEVERRLTVLDRIRMSGGRRTTSDSRAS